MDGRTDGQTDRCRQQQYPFSLKGQGVKMITAVCQITSCTIGCLLYNSSNADIKTNIEIFEHVQIYIYIYLKPNVSELNSKYTITFWHAPGVISVYKTLSCKPN